MVVIGLTGSVGTGKSTVAGMFHRLGAQVLDADAIAHQLLEPKRLGWRRVVRTFGESILNDDQTINRAALARIVFRNKARRRQLEAILHPQVLRRIKQELCLARHSGRVPAIVLDVPLLVEAGAQRLVDALIVVTAPAAAQRARLAQRHGWSEDEIEARIRAQWELSAKAALADYVIDNSDGVDATRTQVRRIWNQLVRRNKPSSTSRRSKS